jgi:predicted DNA-binding protein
MGQDGADAKRVTTTLTIARKRALERLAEREGVKEAWIVRRALERYLDEIGDGPVLVAERGGVHARG